ncbi:MAG: hypothetical protein IPL67_16525 [Ignavibacteria bacterium]|nr:hypothetical protein [Ignavibacteria bacterium]
MNQYQNGNIAGRGAFTEGNAIGNGTFMRLIETLPNPIIPFPAITIVS